MKSSVGQGVVRGRRAGSTQQRTKLLQGEGGEHSPREVSKPFTKMVVPSEAAKRFSPGVPAAQHAQQEKEEGLPACQYAAAGAKQVCAVGENK